MLRLIEVKGKDAAGFLDRVTAGTVRKLAVGHGAPGLLLNGQSRMIAQFDLLRAGESDFWLATPTACVAALTEHLERLHFSEELEIHDAGRVAGAISGGGERGRIFSWVKEGNEKRWPSGVPCFDFITGIVDVPESWAFARIGAGIPWPPTDWDENTPALEGGQLYAIDRDKGCYPGQEVVERSLNVGHPARVLVVVEGEEHLRSGTKVPLVPAGEGVVRSVAARGKDVRAFLLVPWNFRASAPAHFRQVRGFS